MATSEDLAAHLDDPRWISVDCRFTLGQTERGDTPISKGISPVPSTPTLMKTFRPDDVRPDRAAPLPSVEYIAQTLGCWGIDETAQVVAYDAPAAHRRHDCGGCCAGSGTTRSPCSTAAGSAGCPAVFTPQPCLQMVVDAARVLGLLHDPAYRIIDSRNSERYRGEHEPINPVTGHIPSAVSGPSSAVLGPDGRFLSPATLAEHFQTRLLLALAQDIAWLLNHLQSALGGATVHARYLHLLHAQGFATRT